MTRFIVTAQPKPEAELRQADVPVAGRYSVTLNNDSIPTSHHVDAALDIFYSGTPITNPRDFEVKVFDIYGDELQPSGDCDPYIYTNEGDVERL